MTMKVVDGLELPERYRQVLKPAELVADEDGRPHRLPRYFYEIDSWQTAKDVVIAPHFGLYEFINTDVREAPVVRSFPRYVPLALIHLAAHLALLRNRFDTYVHIAANGGYRSPSHGTSDPASVHHWGTAANIYRIGDDYLDSESTQRHYGQIISELLPALWVRPYGSGVGSTIDHLHVDLGRYVVTPSIAATDGET